MYIWYVVLFVKVCWISPQRFDSFCAIGRETGLYTMPQGFLMEITYANACVWILRCYASFCIFYYGTEIGDFWKKDADGLKKKKRDFTKISSNIADREDVCCPRCWKRKIWLFDHQYHYNVIIIFEIIIATIIQLITYSKYMFLITLQLQFISCI